LLPGPNRVQPIPKPTNQRKFPFGPLVDYRNIAVASSPEGWAIGSNPQFTFFYAMPAGASGWC
jgi:hypothetical protein